MMLVRLFVMSLHMPTPTHHYDILDLYRQGWSQTQIAHLLGISRRTIYNHVHQRVFLPGKNRGRPRGSRKIQPFEAKVQEFWHQQGRLNMQHLMAHLRDLGYSGGLSTLREYCRSLKHSMRPCA